jgi:hypothetical protein
MVLLVIHTTKEVGESSYKAEIQLMSSNQAMLPHNLNE